MPYNNFQPFELPHLGAEKTEFRLGLDGGVRYDIPARGIGPSESPSLHDVFFEEGSIGRAYGHSAAIGTAVASGGIVGLGHAWFGSGASTIHRFIIDIDGTLIGRLSAQYYPAAGDWSSVSSSTTRDIPLVGIRAPLASIVSIYGDILVTAGGKIQRKSTLVDTLADLSASAPQAWFIAPFGTRVLALYVDDDPQKVAWCASGDVTTWSGAGTGTSILADVRADAVDVLQGGVQVADALLALFRSRSIMRAYTTGNSAAAIGFLPWVNNIGTESPYSIINLGMGAGFLGNDLMPYILTGSGQLLPVGKPIWKEIKRTTAISELFFVNSAYDPVTGEWWLAFPDDDIAWIFSVSKYATEQKIVWRSESIDASVLGNVASPNFGATYTSGILFGTSTNVYHHDTAYTTRAGAGYTGRWMSPPLNKTNLATLSMVTLAYTSPTSTTVVLKTTKDGGATWHKTKTVNLAATGDKQEVVQVGDIDTTGPDVRFQIDFAQTVACRIHGFLPNIIERGSFEYRN